MAKPVRDSRILIDEVEFFDPPTEEQRDRARRIVAGQAAGETRAEQVADAENLMMMLGVHPDQPIEDEQEISWAGIRGIAI